MKEFFFVWQLVLGASDGGVESIPSHYSNKEICEQAGKEALQNVKGIRLLGYTCVPVERKP